MRPPDPNDIADYDFRLGARYTGSHDTYGYEQFLRRHSEVQTPSGEYVIVGIGPREPQNTPVDRVIVVAGVTDVARLVQEWSRILGGRRESPSPGDLPLNGVIDLIHTLRYNPRGVRGTLARFLSRLGLPHPGSMTLRLDNAEIAITRPPSNVIGPSSVYTAALRYQERYIPRDRRLDRNGFTNVVWNSLGDVLFNPAYWPLHYTLPASPTIASMATALRGIAYYAGLVEINGIIRRSEITRAPEHAIATTFNNDGLSVETTEPALDGVVSVDVSGEASWNGDLSLALMFLGKESFSLFGLARNPVGEWFAFGERVPSTDALQRLLSRLFVGDQTIRGNGSGGGGAFVAQPVGIAGPGSPISFRGVTDVSEKRRAPEASRAPLLNGDTDTANAGYPATPLTPATNAATTFFGGAATFTPALAAL